MPDMPHGMHASIATAAGTATIRWLPGPADTASQAGVLRLTAGDGGFSGSLLIELPIAGSKPYWMIPGLWYGDGRGDDRPTYPGLGPLDPAAFRAPAWDFPAERCALPIALAWTCGRWRGLEAGPHWTLRDAAGAPVAGWRPDLWDDSEPQVGIGLAWDGGAGALRLTLPGADAPRRNTRCRYDAAHHPRLRLPPGWSAETAVVVWDYPGGSGGFARACAACRYRLAADHHAAEALDDGLVVRTAAAGILDWHFVDHGPGHLVYTAAFDRTQEFNANNRGTSLGWHFEPLGFVGGFFAAYGLWTAAARGGPPAGAATAARLVDRWCREAPGERGIFRTSYHPGPIRTANGTFANPAAGGPWNPDPSGATPFYGSCWMPQGRLHARTVADAALHLTRILAGPGRNDPRVDRWRQALRGCLEGVLSLQQGDGGLGTVWDPGEGAVIEARGVAGILWVCAFIESADLFADDGPFVDRLQTAARRLGERHLGDLTAGVLSGAPEDTSLSPSSESGTIAMGAYRALARLDGDRWLPAWRQAADWTLTWRRGFNQRFAPRSQFGSFGLRTRGAELASSQNHQLHIWGLIDQESLTSLSAATGDPAYAGCAEDMWRFAGQMLVTEPGQWNAQVGMCTEQFYATDWSVWDAWDPGPAHRQKGTAMGSSHLWCVAFFLLAAEQRRRAGTPASG